MHRNDAIEFVVSGKTECTIIAMRDILVHENRIKFYVCAWVAELSGIIVQCDSWSEEDIKAEVAKSYRVMRMFLWAHQKVKLPESVEFKIEWADP